MSKGIGAFHETYRDFANHIKCIALHEVRHIEGGAHAGSISEPSDDQVDTLIH